jgi:hypothetical protein
MKYLNKFISKTLLGFSLVNLAFGKDVYYTIREGDHLSKIVEENFPEDFIYGKGRRLYKVLKLNPTIKNPDSVRIGQVIKLSVFLDEQEENSRAESPAIPNFVVADSVPNPVVVEPVPNPVVVEPVLNPVVVEPIPAEVLVEPEAPLEPSNIYRRQSSLNSDEWITSLSYGFHFNSTTQSGALGNAKLGVLSINALKFKSEFAFENWSHWLSIHTYQYKFDSPGNRGGSAMSAIDLGFSYNWIFASIGVEHSPLFKALGSNVVMAREGLMYFSLGLKKDFNLPTQKLSTLKLSAFVRYPLTVLTENSQIDINNTKGFIVGSQSEISRAIVTKDNYSINLYWSNAINYKELSRNVTWDSYSGKVSTTQVDLSTVLGVSFKF